VGGLLAMRVVAYGWWFWIYAACAHSLVLLGAFLIGRQYFRSFHLYRRQSTWVVVGVLIPIVTNIIYIFHLVPGLRKDFTSVSFAFASAAFGVGLLRYHLFDLKPIARDIVIDNMSDAMLTLDAQGRIVDLNPAAQRLVSVLNGQAGDHTPIGQSVIHVLKPWRALLEHLGASAEMQADVAVQVEGLQQCYDMQVAPLTDQSGQLAGRLIVLRDITARKEAEKQLQQYALELEAQNEELDAFARTAAHDLKDPLSFLITGSEYLSENIGRVSEQEIGDFLTAILVTSYTMANIVDELLLLARVRRSTDIELQPLDMCKLVGNITSRLGQLIAETRAQIVIADHWPTAVGYAPWVEEVWSNYLSNALKYGGWPDHGVPPRVELGYGWDSGESEGEPPGDLPGSHVRFWVRDHGPGLSEQEQAQLFVEFSRLDKTNTEGSGLGLVIVRRIVERLGGEAGVESQVGQGSTFWFTLAREREKERP
jgi:signal transduction histidine kinase